MIYSSDDSACHLAELLFLGGSALGHVSVLPSFFIVIKNLYFVTFLQNKVAPTQFYPLDTNKNPYSQEWHFHKPQNWYSLVSSQEKKLFKKKFHTV